MVSVVRWFYILDVGTVLRRIRLAWIVGFVWSGWSFVGAVSGIWSLTVIGDEGLGLLLFILVIVEVGLMGGLSYGVLRRKRFFGLVLFSYFWFSRLFWILVGLIGATSRWLWTDHRGRSSIGLLFGPCLHPTGSTHQSGCRRRS